MTSYNDIPSLAKRIKELERRMSETEGAPRAGFTGISDGGGINLYDPVTGALVGRYGRQFDGTYNASSLGGPVPPTPLAPSVAPVPGGVQINWNGGFVDGVIIPMDFSRVEIHASLVSGFEPDESTVVGTFESPRGGTHLFMFDVGQTIYIKLVTRTQSGKGSLPSVQNSGVSEPVVGDIPVPAVPDILSISPSAGHSENDERMVVAGFVVSWSPVVVDTNGAPITVTGYELWIRTAPLGWRFAKSVVGPSILSPDGTVAVLEDLVVDKSYDFRVRAFTDVAMSDFSDVETSIAPSSLVDEYVDLPGVAVSSQLSTLVLSYTGYDAATTTPPPVYVQRVEVGVRLDPGDPYTVVNSIPPIGSSSTPIPVSNLNIGESYDVAARYVTYFGTEGAWQPATGSPVTLVGVVDEDLVDTTIQTSIDTANTNADAALTAANSKNKITYSTSDASGSGSLAGDTWYKRDGSGNILAIWRWDGSAWQSQVVSNTALGNVDAGKITTGTLDANRIAAASIASEKVFVGAPSQNTIPNGAGELDGAYGWGNLTWDTVDRPSSLPGVFRSAVGQGSLGLQTVANGSGFFPVQQGVEYLVEFWIRADLPNSRIYIELRNQDNAQAIATSSASNDGGQDPGVTPYIATNLVVPTVWTRYSKVITVTSTTTKVRVGTVYFNHANGTERNAQIWLGGMRMRPRSTGSLIVDGSITARTIATGSVESDKLAANAVIAGKINAGAIDGMIITGAVIQTANFGQRVRIDINGLQAFNSLSQLKTSISASDGTLTATDGTFTGTINAKGGNIDGTLTINEGRIQGTPDSNGRYYRLSSNDITWILPDNTSSLSINSAGVIDATQSITVTDDITIVNPPSTSTRWSRITDIGFTNSTFQDSTIGGISYRVVDSINSGQGSVEARRMYYLPPDPFTFESQIITNYKAAGIDVYNFGTLPNSDDRDKFKIDSDVPIIIDSAISTTINGGTFAIKSLAATANKLTIESSGVTAFTVGLPGNPGGELRFGAGEISRRVGTFSYPVRMPDGVAAYEYYGYTPSGTPLIANFPMGLKTITPTLDDQATTKLYVDSLINVSQASPAFFTGWGNYPSGTYNQLKVTRIGSIVLLNGMFSRTGATIATGTATHNVADVSGAGGTPSKVQIWLGKGYTGSAYVDVRVDIQTNGTVTAAWLTTGPWTQNTSWVFVNMIYNAID